MLLKFLGILLVLLIAIIVIGRFVFPLPELTDRSQSTSLPPVENTKLGTELKLASERNPGLSGIEPLQSGEQAFVARMALARAATRSIDAQYYIWHKDITGLLLLKELRAAAERGVRVRLLVDDNGSGGLDDILTALNNLPTFEVRLYNPFMLRSPRVLNYVFDFFRLNRRMHNKSFTVDNLATIVGGRNIGDEYFGAGDNPQFIDLDVLTVGAVVGQVSTQFDGYWASQSAYPLDQVFNISSDLSALENEVSRVSSSKQFIDYQQAIKESQVVQKLQNRELSLGWSPVKMISDDPIKTLGKAEGRQLLAKQMVDYIAHPQSKIDLITPYFVPGKQGTQSFSELSKSGIKIRILTNSKAATDVIAVHSGYTKYRTNLLQSGVGLFELKASFTGNESPSHGLSFGSSGASLHAKTFSIDRKRAFVGSFNFDARSTYLNTELGFLIENPQFAQMISKLFDERLSEFAYQPHLNSEGKLVWLDHDDKGAEKILTQEPHTNTVERLILKILGFLPIEWLL